MAVTIKPPEHETVAGSDKGYHREADHPAGTAAAASDLSLEDDGDGSQSAYSEFEDEGGRGEEEQYSEFEDDDEVRRKGCASDTNPRTRMRWDDMKETKRRVWAFIRLHNLIAHLSSSKSGR